MQLYRAVIVYFYKQSLSNHVLQTSAFLRSPSPVMRWQTAPAPATTTHVNVSVATLAMENSVKVCHKNVHAHSHSLRRACSHACFISPTDINECLDPSACPNAKFECVNMPGSVRCSCRYQKTRDTDGCGKWF